MSYVFEIVFALVSLALPELGFGTERALPLFALALVAVPYLLGWGARRALLAGRFRTGALLERLLVFSPVLLQVAAVSGLGWLRALELQGYRGVALDGWLDLSVLLGLFPYLLYQVAAIDARARSLVFPPERPQVARTFQLRLFLAALVPFLAYLAGSGFLARSLEWRVCLEEVGLLGGFLTVLLVAVFLYGMPVFLRYAWDTAAIEPGWARTMLEQVARSAGFRFRELLVWRTGQQLSNAAIVGFTERSRLVFFSDLLLQQLGPRELAAVFAHEMGHARRAHGVVFGAFALGFFLAAQQVLELLRIEDELFAIGILVLLVGLWYVSFGYLSRRFELEADLESLRVVGESSALVRALELVTGAHAHAKSSWRHFSTRDRVTFLRAAEADPLVGIRLRLKLARWRKLGFALFAVAALLQVRDLARSWDEDWIVADLRLGRFEEAARRAAAEGIDPELAHLARRAATAPLSNREAKQLGVAALKAMTRGDLEGAKEWLRLARLRGAQEVDPLLQTLEEEGEDAAMSLPEAWQGVLERFKPREKEN